MSLIQLSWSNAPERAYVSKASVLDTTRLILRELQINGLTCDPLPSSTDWAVARMKVPLCECALSLVAKAASENDRNLTSSGGSG